VLASSASRSTHCSKGQTLPHSLAKAVREAARPGGEKSRSLVSKGYPAWFDTWNNLGVCKWVDPHSMVGTWDTSPPFWLEKIGDLRQGLTVSKL